MKKYIKPIVKIVETETSALLTNSNLGREYNRDDVSYGRGHRGNLTDWDDDED